MHRRRFLALVVALAIAPQLAAARQFDVETTPPPDAHADEWLGIRYEHPDPDAPIRSIEVRVSFWSDPSLAGTAAGSLTANARTPLPEGEFYHSEVTAWTPDHTDDRATITGQEWSTTVGVAAFTTWYAQAVAWQGRQVTVVLVSGGSADLVRDEANEQLARSLDQIPVPCGPPLDYLPGIDDVPEGMTVVWRTGNKEFTDVAGPHGAWKMADCTMTTPPA